MKIKINYDRRSSRSNTVKNSFDLFGITNISREIPRMIEIQFGLTVSRTPKTGKSRYGQAVSYTQYRLNKSDHNLEGIEKLKAYINEQLGLQPAPKTDKQAKLLKQTVLFMESI